MAKRYFIGMGSRPYKTLTSAKKTAQRYANEDNQAIEITDETVVGGNVTAVSYHTVIPKHKRTARRKNTGLDLSKWIPASFVKIDKDSGNVHIMKPAATKNSGRRVKNIAQGFYGADGRFHPIRASADYDPDRLEDDTEGSYRPKRRATKRKKVATKKRKPARRANAAKKKVWFYRATIPSSGGSEEYSTDFGKNGKTAAMALARKEGGTVKEFYEDVDRGKTIKRYPKPKRKRTRR